MSQYEDKFRIVPRNQPLIPANILETVITVVYQALLEGKQIHGCYRRRGQQANEEVEYDLHPLGLVFRESVVYLVVTFRGYQDVRQLALHRFLDCQLLDEPCTTPKGFSLDAYVQSGAFDYEQGNGKPIQLVALFARGAALHLHETPLSQDQQIDDVNDEWVRVTAKVLNTQQLRWWLLGFGAYVQVLQPLSLREEFVAVSKQMVEVYE